METTYTGKEECAKLCLTYTAYVLIVRSFKEFDIKNLPDHLNDNNQDVSSSSAMVH